MKKIYFSCSIRGGRQDASIYKQIIKIIKPQAEVIGEVLASSKLTQRGSNGNVQDIYKKDIKWMADSDAVIAEVTNPSLGVGYELARAEFLDKPILALYRPQPDRRLSAMIAGSPKIQVMVYESTDDLETVIQAFIADLSL
jgi:nucleoside 2-deoxyribosyltransferase